MNHNRVNFMKPPRSIYSPGAAVRPAHRRRQMWGARGGVYGRNNVRWELLQMPSGAGKDGMRPWCQGARHVFCSNCADHTRYLAGGQTGEPPCPRTLHQTRAELYKVFCIGTAVVGALRGCAKEIGKTVCCGQNKLRPALQAQQQRGWAGLPRAQRRSASSQSSGLPRTRSRMTTGAQTTTSLCTAPAPLPEKHQQPSVHHGDHRRKLLQNP